MQAKSGIIGKTYSLYSGNDDTDEFYSELSDLADSFLSSIESEELLLSLIRKSSNKKRLLKAEKKNASSESLIAKLLIKAESSLSKYFTDIDDHLKNLSLVEKCDSTLTTSREQYLLYMLEIELVNRLNREKFDSSESKYAFLPHCFMTLIKNACLLPMELIMFVRVVQKIVPSTQ